MTTTQTVTYTQRERGGWYGETETGLIYIVRQVDSYKRTSDHFRWSASFSGLKGSGPTRDAAIADLRRKQGR